jgi:hypothetical protein
MLIQKQLLRHKPDEGVFGDCHRTAIAAMFDLRADEVPHIAEDGPAGDEFSRRERAWLRSQGFAGFHVVYENADVQSVLAAMNVFNPSIYYLLGGRSRTGCGHTVVCCGDQIVCDPSPDDSGIIGPCGDGYFWVTVFVSERFTSGER